MSVLDDEVRVKCLYLWQFRMLSSSGNHVYNPIVILGLAEC